MIKERQIDSTTHINYDTIKRRYDNIVKNTKSFNRGILGSKTVKLGNGFRTYFFKKSNGVNVREITLLSDRFGWDLYVTDFLGVSDGR
jgi:hypothetical protein